MTTQVDPAKAGLTPDWRKTLDNAGSQPVNPITRVMSFFSTREVPFEIVVDRTALDTTLAEAGGKVAQEPVEGTIKYANAVPSVVEPQEGRKVDPAAADLVVEILGTLRAGGTFAILDQKHPRARLDACAELLTAPVSTRSTA
ncbi:peptidoglycan binding domain-containing protein, partial [Kibdelosporangium lantanae]